MLERGSLRGDAVVQFGSEIIVLGVGILTSAIVARSLGPSGKGVFSTLLLMTGILGQLSTLGTDESATIAIAQRSATSSQVARSLAVPLGVAMALACVILVAVAPLVFSDLPPPGYLLALGVPLLAVGTVFTGFLNAVGQLRRASRAKVVGRCIGGGCLVGFLLLGPVSLGQAVAAELLALGLWTGALLRAWARSKAEVGPPAPPEDLRPSLLRRGVSFQLARLVRGLSARFDLVMVAVLAGPAAAGLYSVALTVAQVGSYPAFVLGQAAFPRIARETASPGELVERVTRAGLAGAALLCIGLAVAVPFALPLVFGPAFRAAVPLALISLVGVLPWTVQLLLGRALAALGDSSAPALSFGSSLVTMVALDVVLIPPFGSYGAAYAAIAASFVGLFVLRRSYRRAFPDRSFLKCLVPGPASAP